MKGFPAFADYALTKKQLKTIGENQTEKARLL